MNKIAVISDIHGNLEALKTVLADIKKKNINTIYCLGDIVAKGAHPNECIDLVFLNCQIILRGNLEDFILSNKDSFKGKEEKQEFYKNQIDEYHLNKLIDLPICHEIYISGSLVRFFHASPVSALDRISEHDNISSKMRAFYPSINTKTQRNADIAIFADLHIQFMERFHNKTLINIGSVGL